MTYYIALDGGTTNTRLRLVRKNSAAENDFDLLGSVRVPMGARAGIDRREKLRAAIRDGIRDLLADAGIPAKDVSRVLASGMITSEYGLCNLPHLVAPAGVKELHDSMAEVTIPEISPISFSFVRGVRTAGKTLDATDMMRGEETELAGLLGALPASDERTLVILPGSHSKLIETDGAGRVTRFSTMLTGEMIAALSSGTILAGSVDLSVTEFDEKLLSDGCRYASEHGVNEALFKVRILKNLYGADAVGTYSFFLGAILSGEIGAIERTGVKRVVVGGKAQIKRATAYLLRELPDREIVTVSDEDAELATVRGVIRIFEYKD